jgi:hypothetical protein
MPKTIKISDELYNSITEYCSLNNIKNVNEEVNKLLQKTFNVEIYGENPFEYMSRGKQKESVDNVGIITVQTEVSEEKEMAKETIKEEKQTPPKKRITIIKSK